ncbi:MAG: DUF58 domain-containing protein, partial [Actinobacteria bacterium]|nr:DUF58 domain-containing protein [Actinomycetota bacterium]
MTAPSAPQLEAPAEPRHVARGADRPRTPAAVRFEPVRLTGALPFPTLRMAVVWAFAAVALVVLNVGYAFWVVNGVLLALLLVDFFLATSPNRVSVERGMPEAISLGVEGGIGWYLTNPTSRALVVHFSDELAPSLHAGTRRERVKIPKKRTVEVRTTFRPTRRGRFEISRLVVRVDGPLGLAGRQRARRMRHVLRVYPPFKSKDEAELRINKARILEVGLRSAQGRGGGTEFDQLREYSVDDEFKRIDWSATARANRAIVRTYRAERNQTVICLLDNGRVMAGRVDDVPRVEHAMDAVMMLTAVASRLGDRAGMVAFDSRIQATVSPGHGRDQLGRVTEAMYDLEPQLAESDYLGAFSHTLARFRRRAMLVIFTELVEQAVHESLLPAMPLIARSHLVVVASVQDPDVVRWATLTPTDATGAYRKAAAVTALDERRRTVARLRGLGATVIDAPPGKLAPRLADAYLRV